MPADVAAAFAAFPERVRARLLEVRDLIFETATDIEGVGPLTETLKWGEPAYLTEASKSGSTIRLGVTRADPPRCAIYLNCKTTLVAEFRAAFAEAFDFEGNRAVLLDPAAPLAKGALAQAITMALTYHRRKRKAA